jgi:hypothetical protein
VVSSLLTVLALSDTTLLEALRQPQVLRHVELSLHSCLTLVAQDIAWRSAWHAVHGLQQVLTPPVPLHAFLVEPYNHVQVLRIWRDIGAPLSALRGLLRCAVQHPYGHR